MKASKRSSASPRTGGLSGSAPIKQRRSQRTYDALVETGLQMARDRDLDTISVAEIAKQAGYSVGAFYARFDTKEDFHRALVERYCAQRIEDFDELFGSVGDDALIEVFFARQIERMKTNHRFWRASLHRSFQDSDFWEPFRGIVRHVGARFIERASRRIGRTLTDEEQRTIRFAIQVANGTINNTMINKPGPVRVEDDEFHPRLVRTFLLVSGWNELA